MLRRMCSPISRQACRLSTKPAKVEVKMNEEMYEKIDTQQVKARKHAGRMKSGIAHLPEWFPKALQGVLEDSSITSLRQDGRRLSNYLHERQLPTEQNVAQMKFAAIKQEIASQKNEERLAHLSAESIEKIENAKGLRLLKRAFYAWSPVQYNKYSGLLYLVSRGAQEYAVLHRIMNEIATRDNEFRPRTLLDFGSGIGTTLCCTRTAQGSYIARLVQGSYVGFHSPDNYLDIFRVTCKWIEQCAHDSASSFGPAGNDFEGFDSGRIAGSSTKAANDLWPEKIQEHVCVDVSVEMNDLSASIIGHSVPKIKGVLYRQYIPISHRTYDVVVSAYTLLELPSMHTRLETIAKLWAKTERYLIIVEQGTNAGFRVVNEARDFILHMQQSREKTNPEAAHIFAPCPHELPCPRYRDKTNTPCNFQTTYEPLPGENRGISGTDRYSYVVFKKGECTDETKDWPRLVRETLVRSKHSICRMCTAQGKLEEVIFRASRHGKWMYWCGRSSRWGDRLPVETTYEPDVQEAEVAEVSDEDKEK